jgi:hypothetical protein
MAYTCITGRSFWSSFHNQATLAFNTSFSAGMNYENRFGIKELGTRTVGVVVPAWRTSVGTIYSCFGHPGFKREMAAIACGLRLSEKIAAGIQADYFSQKTSGEYNNQYLTCEAGLLFLASENTTVGIHIFNPLPSSPAERFLPLTLRTGVGTQLSSLLVAAFEAEMSEGHRLNLSTGFEYEALKKVWIRGGFCTNNTSFSFGLGYLLNFLKMDLGFATHEMLGVTSSVSLIFIISK